MRVALAALALWVVLAAPAAADVYDDNPATATRGANDQWVFARGAGGDILERHWTGTAWSDWASLGGNATSGPAAAGYGKSVVVFIRGTDAAVHQNTFIDGAWTGWSSLGGYATSGPSVSVRRGPQGYLDLSMKGSDNAIWLQTFVPGTGWSGWTSRGGNLTSAPTMNSQADGILNLWSRGIDGAVKQQSWTGSAWTDWADLGSSIIGAPGSVSRAENLINLYVRGAANAVYQRSWSGSGWSAWALLDPAPIDSSPAAAGDSASHEWIVARRGASVAIKDWNAATGGWGAWTDLGTPAVPVPAPAPTAPAPAPDGEVSLEAGVRCTPPGGRLRVNIKVRKAKGKAKARVVRIVFFTKGKGRTVRVDRKSPFVVRMKVNRPAGSSGRVYARVHFRRSAKGKLSTKTVSRRYTVCR
jgi:hypothetical protein